ncbi:MAG: Nif3-like dinuclear metal center hexameric protein [Candidatus Riflebacteria bacterium]|nr:Nif3-like dinuclear metal center hexameric protein [Candidatus Riflebacteria bacterium]
MQVKDLVIHIKELLNYEQIKDSSYNGLQFTGSNKVKKIVSGVDASIDFLREARRRDAEFAIVHHGMFWKGGEVSFVDKYWKNKFSELISGNINLFALHLPLDLHADFGNNPILARLLGLKIIGNFCDYQGSKVGVYGEYESPKKIGDVLKDIEKKIGKISCHLNFGEKKISRVGIVSGGGGSAISDRIVCEENIDLILTGEIHHQHYFSAEERKIHAVSAGHYLTEIFGVKALGDHLAEKFNLQHEFIDLPTGL